MHRSVRNYDATIRPVIVGQLTSNSDFSGQRSLYDNHEPAAAIKHRELSQTAIAFRRHISTVGADSNYVGLKLQTS